MKITLRQILFFALLMSLGCASTKKVIIKDDSELSEMEQYFKAIPKKPVRFNIQRDTFTAPIGGHLQGIQQVDKRHLVVTGSSNAQAYFFIAKMKGITRLKRRGIIIKKVDINKDFPLMKHNHASGIQIMDNLLAIGTEGGGDRHKSSVVFYDLAQPEQPKALPCKIDRSADTAGAIGLTKIGQDSLLLAVGGWDSDRIDFYQSVDNLAQLDFKMVATWHNNQKDTKTWIDGNWGPYQSLNFVKDQSNKLHLVGFYQNSEADMIADLYDFDVQQAPSQILRKIATQKFDTKEGVSFKNGAGLSLFNLPRRLNMLATARDWDLLIRLNYW